ncbi:MAG: hypothetical protein DRP78_05480, partial [Candidatus Omnitrophota bacterium]
MATNGSDTIGDGSSGNEWLTLRYATSQMSGGDTLIIREGTYSGTNNVLWQFALPPSGTSDNFTIIRAEHDGMAVFENGFIHMNNTATRSYISFEGLKSLDYTMIYGSGINHFKFLRCAFYYSNPEGTSANANLWIGLGCTYILAEDCYAWGAGRYRFVLGGSHHVLRRCVARYDRGDWTDPMAQFSSYGADDVAFQNCIAIDSDHPEFWVTENEKGGTFYIHHGSQNNIVDSCISVNDANSWITGSPGHGLSIKNSLAIDSGSYGLTMRGDSGVGDYLIDKCTLLNITNYGLDPWYGSVNSVSARGCVLYGIASAAMHGTNLGGSDQGYNVLYNNNADFSGVSAVATDYCADNGNAVDPIDGTPGNGISAILYPVRIEASSDLYDTGFGGDNRGATILKRVGISGTFWGEEGWNETTEENLWPFPNEDRIKADMEEYIYTGPMVNGPIGTLYGNR